MTAAHYRVTIATPADVITLPVLEARHTHSGWLARCPAHEDRTRSLSLRLGNDSRLLINCFAGCRTEEILSALDLELRDLFPAGSARVPRAAPPQPRSALDRARAEILREGRRQQARLAPYRALFLEADYLRTANQTVSRARQVATTLGETDRAWGLLADAAVVEQAAFDAEAELDRILAEKRLP